MPEPWVILISVELFWPESLSYFAENAWVIKNPVNWVILVKIVEFWWRNPFQKCIKTRKMSIFLKENVISYNNFLAPWFIFPIFYQKCAENLSYFPKRLELFPKPWVILLQKSLSYFWIVEKKSLSYCTHRLHSILSLFKCETVIASWWAVTEKAFHLFMRSFISEFEAIFLEELF